MRTVYEAETLILAYAIEYVHKLKVVAKAANSFLDALDNNEGDAYLPDDIDLGNIRRALAALEDDDENSKGHGKE